jgi:hypothetical protein
MNYTMPFGVLPHGNLFSSPDVFGYHGNSAGMLLMPPPVGQQSMTSLERNEATYRWLCACSQNLAAQMQMFQTRASSMMGQVITSGSADNLPCSASSRSPIHNWMEQRTKSPANKTELTTCLSDDGQSNSD